MLGNYICEWEIVRKFPQKLIIIGIHPDWRKQLIGRLLNRWDCRRISQYLGTADGIKLLCFVEIFPWPPWSPDNLQLLFDATSFTLSHVLQSPNRHIWHKRNGTMVTTTSPRTHDIFVASNTMAIWKYLSQKMVRFMYSIFAVENLSGIIAFENFFAYVYTLTYDFSSPLAF